jgi:hypothetical protein
MDEKRLAQLKERVRRQANRVVLGGAHRPHAPAASWFGKVTVGRPGEEWPEYDGGPMWPLCQIDCAELPYAPAELANTAFICVFAVPTPEDWGQQNGDGWLLRAYTEGDRGSLIQLVEPDHGSEIRPFSVAWELIEEDWPGWEDLVHFLTREEVDDFLAGGEALPFETIFASKVGGWPSYLQSEIFPEREHTFVFQIDSEYRAGWAWGDQGLAYFALDPVGEWLMEWQCL